MRQFTPIANPLPPTTPQLCIKGFSQNKRTNRRSQSRWRTERQGGRFGKTTHKEINNNASNHIEQQCGRIRQLLPRQESAGFTDDDQASGQRKAYRQSQRGPRYTRGHDEAQRGGQPIVGSEEQCAERDLIRGGTGRCARDRWPDSRTYGRAQGHGHAGPDEEFAGCTVVQQRIRGSAETTARCLGSDLQWGQSVRGFCDQCRRYSKRYISGVSRERCSGQHYRDLHQQRRIIGDQDQSLQVRGAFGPDCRCERPDQGQHFRSGEKRQCLRIIRKRYRSNYLARRVRTVDGSVRTGVIKCRVSSCTNRWWNVPPDFCGGQHLFDGDQSAFGNRTDRGCGYRRRECEPGEVLDSHTGVGCDGGSGQLDQRYRPDAAPVKEPWARPELSDGPTAQSANPVNLQTQMLSQITIHTGPRLPQPLWAVRAAWKPPGKTKHKEIIQCP